MLHDSSFTKIFIENTGQNRDAGVEDIVCHQADRVEQTCSRDPRNERKSAQIRHQENLFQGKIPFN